MFSVGCFAMAHVTTKIESNCGMYQLLMQLAYGGILLFKIVLKYSIQDVSV